MRQEPSRKQKETTQRPLEEGSPKKGRPEHDQREVRLPIQAAPVRRTAYPPGPFRQEVGPKSICQILSSYAVAQCLARAELMK
jgi:hypothetical protein